MARVTLPTVIPVVLLLGTIGLFVHRWTAEPSSPPPPTTAAWRAATHGDTATGSPATPAATSSVPPPGATAPAGGPAPSR
jgi:hypothetical protein